MVDSKAVIGLAVSALIFVIFFVFVIPILIPAGGISVRVADMGLTIRTSSAESSRISTHCRDFYDSFFSPDYEYGEFTRGLFPGSDGDVLYRESKLLCGALLEIEEAVDQGGNLEATVEEINDAYGTAYEGLEFDYGEIRSVIEENPEKEAWLHEVEQILIREIDGRVS